MSLFEWIRTVGIIVSAVALIFGMYKFTKEWNYKQQKVKPDFSMGALAFGKDLSDAQLFLNARNTSGVPVHLKTFVLHFKKGDVEGQLIDGYGSNPKLPSQLQPGDSLVGWHDLRSLARSLAAQGVTGKIDVHGYFVDGLNKKYRARKPFKLDVDDWGKEKS